MTDKKLVFKVSDFLEEQGFLDVNEGEVPDEATRLSWQERRKKDDEYDMRQSNEVHTFSATNVRPVFPYNEVDRSKILAKVLSYLEQTPTTYTNLERTFLSGWNSPVRGHRVDFRNLIKYAIDKGFIEMDGSLKLQCKLSRGEFEERSSEILEDLIEV